MYVGGCSVFLLRGFLFSQLKEKQESPKHFNNRPWSFQAKSDQIPFSSIVTVMSFDRWVAYKNRRKLK